MATQTVFTAVPAAYPEAPVDFIIKSVHAALDKIDPAIRILERLLIKYVPKQYAAVTNHITSKSSPLVKGLPLLEPVQVLFFVIAYLSIVFIGKRITQYTPRIDAKTFSLFHNFAMVALSGYMCFSIAAQAWADNYSLFANPTDHTAAGIPMTKLTWLFYISKLPEFIDTFIMVIKKNYRQISFLHVYHHCSIFLFTWYVTLIAPNGDAYFSATLNSFIHVVMYGYYFLSALGFKSVSFIKRYITVGQMTQFGLNFIQANYNILDGYYLRPALASTDKMYPPILSVILWFYMVSMLALFYNFFVQDRRRAMAAKNQAPVAKKLN